MLSIASGARRLVNVVNFSMFLTEQGAHVRDDARDGAGGGREWACEERPSALTLPPLEIAVACRNAIFAWLQLIAVHRDTHGTTGLAPVRSRFFEDAVQTLGLRLLFDLLRAGHYHHAYLRVHSPAFQ